MSAIVFDKGIPVPSQLASGDSIIDVCDRMEVGDSFVVPSRLKTPGTLAGQANRILKAKGKRFVGRKTPDGHRVWRTA